jgi:DNA primase small subunit
MNERLSLFYREIFPCGLILEWLRYTKTREFSFVLPGDVYVRYLVLQSEDEFREKLAKEMPSKVDIGAVYSMRPALGCENNAVMKELVFDVDLTDYGRACCGDSKDMCKQCLPLLKCAVEVLRHILQEDLGFLSTLFVFSGGRGVHCWVSGSIPALLSDQDRASVVKYVEGARTNREVVQILEKYREYVGKDASEEVLVDRLYPRLDKNVSKQMRHLLKSPFCVHPRTGKICVPIDVDKIGSLTLEGIPTLQTACENRLALEDSLAFFRNYVGSIY